MKAQHIVGLLFTIIILSVGCNGENKSRKNSAPVPVKSASTEKNDGKNEIVDATQSDGATPEQLAKAKEIIASVSKEEVSSINAKKLYKMNCGICHGFKGNMMINGAKDLTISKISLQESVAQVYFGKGLMTPFKGVLKDAEIVAVSTYVETLRK